MMGNAFSKTIESAGWMTKEEKLDLSQTLKFPLERPTSLVKRYRGQASASFQKEAFGKSNACPEGAIGSFFEPKIDCSAKLADLIYQINTKLLSRGHALWM